MSERTKDIILAKHLILVNAGIKISESMKKAVEIIERERLAIKVAKA